MGDPLWRGVAVALVTLFDGDGAVDAPATAAHAARLVDLGIRAVLVAGSTGEAEALTDVERLALLTEVRRACPAVPVLVGAVGPWAGPVVDLVTACAAGGADAVLVAPPRRLGDLAAFYRRVRAAAGDMPVLAYHFPGVVGAPVPVEALAGLPIDGIKDSTGDPERLLHTLESWSGWTYVGSSTVAGYAGQVGAAGAILAVANAVPEDCVAAFDGDGAAQRRLLGPHLAARDDFPRGLKQLVSRRFGIATGCRIG